MTAQLLIRNVSLTSTTASYDLYFTYTADYTIASGQSLGFRIQENSAHLTLDVVSTLGGKIYSQGLGSHAFSWATYITSLDPAKTEVQVGRVTWQSTLPVTDWAPVLSQLGGTDTDTASMGFGQVLSSAQTATAVPLSTSSLAAYTASTSVMASPGLNIEGTGATDSLQGSFGDDTINGLAGDDSIDGQAGSDKILGGDGNDKLAGNYGNDSLYGEAGDDTLTDDQGANYLDGGDGSDNLTAKSLTGSQNLLGGLGNDNLNATGAVVSLSGGAGDDWIYADGQLRNANYNNMGNVIAGKAVLTGDAGNDDLHVNSYSMASMSGGDGDDNLKTYGTRMASLSGDAGKDNLAVIYNTWASQQSDGNGVKDKSFVLDGGADEDTLSVVGNSYNGNFTGQSGQITAVLRGGSGNDLLSVIDDNAGLNNINYLGTNPYGVVKATLDGGDGNDVLSVGGVLQASLTGGAGSDVFKLTAQAYKTLLEGTRNFLTEAGSVGIVPTAMMITDFAAGAGGDVLDYSDLLRNAATTYDGSNPFTSGYLKLVQNGADTWLQVDADGGMGLQNTPLTLAVLKNVTASSLLSANFSPNYSPDGAAPIPLNLTGTIAAETLSGGFGNDAISGLAGDDSIDGQAGSDKILGGDGNDTLVGNYGNDSLYGEAGDDTLTDDQGTNYLDGGDGRDNLTARSMTGGQTLLGGLGNDNLNATGAVVNLSGGAGDDALYAEGQMRSANGSMMGNVIGGTAILSGDAGNDYLSVNNYSMASLSGGEGDDAFTLVNNRLASISGDAGNDWMAVRYDTWASQQTDGNVVKDRNFVLD
eukprot:gene11937-13845_t